MSPEISRQKEQRNCANSHNNSAQAGRRNSNCRDKVEEPQLCDLEAVGDCCEETLSIKKPGGETGFQLTRGDCERASN